jgi:hypothetical protein
MGLLIFLSMNISVCTLSICACICINFGMYVNIYGDMYYAYLYIWLLQGSKEIAGGYVYKYINEYIYIFTYIYMYKYI